MPWLKKGGAATEASWFRAQFHTSPVSSLRFSRATAGEGIVALDSIRRSPLDHGTLWLVFSDQVVCAVSARDVAPGSQPSVPLPPGGKPKGLWPPPPPHLHIDLSAFESGSPLNDCVACSAPSASGFDLGSSSSVS